MDFNVKPNSPKVYAYEVHVLLTTQKVCYHLESEFPKYKIILFINNDTH